MIEHAFLYGLDDSGLTTNQEGARLHPLCMQAYKRMRQAAFQDGIDLAIASSYRHFDHQAQIWTRKYQHPKLTLLSPQERVENILLWSALPGSSRHHWGTDFDCYAPHQIERDELRLEPWEYELQEGPCYELFCWMQTHAHKYGFYRPYDEDRGGVAPEPWHWSYAPLSLQYIKQFNSQTLQKIILQYQLAGLSSLINEQADFIENYVQCYVFNIAPCLLPT